MWLADRVLFVASTCAATSLFASNVLAQAYPLASFQGTSAGEELGRCLAGGVDVDLDGHVDFAIGGRDVVLVVSGATGSVIHTLHSASGNPGFGSAVALTGDLDGDEHAEILVGETSTLGSALPSAAIVYSGATGSVVRTHPYPPSPFTGRALTGLGDVDFDGVADYASCSPSSPGLVVYSGATGVEVFQADTYVPPVPPAPAEPTPARPIASVGDYNGDGVADLLLGEHQPVDQSDDDGFATVRSGADGSKLTTLRTPEHTPWFGVSVASLGDITGDGVHEFLVGGPRNFQNFTSPGFVVLIDGAKSEAMHTFKGKVPGEEFGSAVANAGDVDGDGVPDILIGAPGNGSGYARLYSGATRRPLLDISGQRRAERFGTAAARIGDLDGDGVPDFAISAPHAVVGSTQQGAVRMLSYAGIPAGSASFGSGCAGSSGATPLALTGGGALTSAGNKAFKLLLTYAKPGAFVALQLGLSNTQSGATSLPSTLDNLGMPACQQLVSADFLVATMSLGSETGEGRASFDLPIPTEAALVGVTAYVQWFVSDPGPAILPGVVSNALQLTIQ